jgi:hypothetical protein
MERISRRVFLAGKNCLQATGLGRTAAVTMPSSAEQWTQMTFQVPAPAASTQLTLQSSRAHQLCSHSVVSHRFMELEVHYRLHKGSPPHPISTNSILMLSTYLRLGLPSGLLPSGFYIFLFSPILATCPVYFILLYLVLLIILGEGYKLCSS